ncbi:hypothetical protein ANN_26804 [Periplaneta americana]|uniref:Uncharacterized protein n=1 Tax=Periplaneta americana TaxID=6978 RepID=A0ABQ8RZM3_PERAM|nr:hypothetical protein ANN_26804 [Periplaneta americana]
MSPRSSTEKYQTFAHIGFREKPGKNLNQVTCPDRESNTGYLVSRPVTVTPQVWYVYQGFRNGDERSGSMGKEFVPCPQSTGLELRICDVRKHTEYIFPLPVPYPMTCVVKGRGDNAGEMSPGSSTESYPAFARIGLRENPGKNLNQVTCPDRDSNPGHLVSRPDALTVTPQRIQQLRAGNGGRRLEFCHWLLVNRRVIPFLLFTDEAIFTRDGINNTRNSHQLSEENPHAIVETHFQQRFSINVWCGMTISCFNLLCYRIILQGPVI